MPEFVVEIKKMNPKTIEAEKIRIVGDAVLLEDQIGQGIAAFSLAEVTAIYKQDAEKK